MDTKKCLECGDEIKPRLCKECDENLDYAAVQLRSYQARRMDWEELQHAIEMRIWRANEITGGQAAFAAEVAIYEMKKYMKGMYACSK